MPPLLTVSQTIPRPTLNKGDRNPTQRTTLSQALFSTAREIVAVLIRAVTFPRYCASSNNVNDSSDKPEKHERRRIDNLDKLALQFSSQF